MWAYANDLIPYIDWRTEPVYFVVLLWRIQFWRLFHFYWVHRLTHWKPLYKSAHYLHHKNINIGPVVRAGDAPDRALVVFSCILIPLDRAPPIRFTC